MKILIFLGTIRDSTPPKPARLGLRVARACMACLQRQFPEHEVELIDPLDYKLGEAFKPHFAYVKSEVPEQLDALAEKIASADGYIMVSPEYNHSMSPALAHLLNHFGSSLYSYKPSAIVTYSAGQWGGLRAALGMRTFLSELGCLPVSAMVHVPKAQEIFAEDGLPLEGVDGDRWHDYLSRAFLQLFWWAEATKKQRGAVDPHKMIRNFTRDPSQRNAPG
ncbi:MAG: NAD(P)H-dependent oxidoreductase [Pseudohongiella sp.]|nr:NAD(P)H-dependent oxidoreductase [Pseudohongiella sp.]